MSDALKDAEELIRKHTLLEADMVLRELVREVERLQQIEAAAKACLDAEPEATDAERFHRWMRHRNDLSVLVRGRT